MPTAPRTASPSDPASDADYPRKRWIVRPADPDAAAELARHLKLSPTTAQALLNRGFAHTNLDAARLFLEPKLGDLLDPATLPGVPQAAERIAKAVREGETIAIFGDYDVDGITATSILWHALIQGGIDQQKLVTYIPHRVDEGYGLNADAIEQLARDGVTVLISVDCGITARDEATRAKKLGVDLIVTDHHEWKHDDAGRPALPDDAFAIVHPRLDGDYANPHLTGAGVAFKLAWEVGKKLAGSERVTEEMKWFLVDALALAALGTIADVAPLVGENRVIARYGLSGIKKTRLHGLRALIDSAGLGGEEIDSTSVGFKLAPRLNACGRMGHAADAVEMLTVAEPGRAKTIAAQLERENRERQATERAIAKQAIEMVKDRGWDADERPAIVVVGDDWHAGVVGIVASRLVDAFCRPTLVLTKNPDGLANGSGRSIEGFNLAEALVGCDDLLDTHGGHAMAAGLRVQLDNIDALRERFTSLAADRLTPNDLRPCLTADATLSIVHISDALERELRRLGPFGAGNPRPLVVIEDAVVLSARSVGKTGDHLQLQLDNGRGVGRIKAIAFGCGDLALVLRGGDRVKLAASLSLNKWQGRETVELEIRDIERL